MIVCMASGNGSNFKAIVEFGIPIDLIITNNIKAGVINKALDANIQCIISEDRYEDCVPDNTELVILAGFMRLLSKEFVTKYPTINIHPSLLPSFKGKDAVPQALDAGVRVAGCTVHWVDEGMDTGKIIEQASCPVWDDDNEHTLHAKIHELEHKIYPKTIKQILLERSIINEQSRYCRPRLHIS